MIDMGIVQGSEHYARPVVVKSDMVYVHTDIELVPREEGEEELTPNYRYHEYKYTHEEYIELISSENNDLKDKNEILSTEVTDIQMALAEVYELIDGGV